MDGATENRRRYIRHPTAIAIEVAPDDRPEPGIRNLRDVSFGGICCGSPENLPEGSLVRVRVPTVRPIFESKARVVWCRKRNGDYDVGMQFLEADDAWRARLVEQVCHIEEYRENVLESEGRDLSPDEAASEWIRRYAADFPHPESDSDE